MHSSASSGTDMAAHRQFLAESASAVSSFRAETIERIRQRNLPVGKWHPNGFAVFHLADVEGIGRLRLHFWPKGLRRPLAGHPPVHTHSWRLYSEILEGQYRDTRYSVEMLGNQTERGAGSGKAYVVRYGGTQADGDLLEDTGEWVGIKPKGRTVSYERGQTHEMVPGMFHATPIPKTRFCSTLLIMSPRVDGFSDVLVGNPQFGTTRHERPAVQEQEVDLMCSQFESHRALDNPSVGRADQTAVVTAM